MEIHFWKLDYMSIKQVSFLFHCNLLCKIIEQVIPSILISKFTDVLFTTVKKKSYICRICRILIYKQLFRDLVLVSHFKYHRNKDQNKYNK